MPARHKAAITSLPTEPEPPITNTFIFPLLTIKPSITLPE
jgi:hypothetical protein